MTKLLAAMSALHEAHDSMSCEDSKCRLCLAIWALGVRDPYKDEPRKALVKAAKRLEMDLT